MPTGEPAAANTAGCPPLAALGRRCPSGGSSPAAEMLELSADTGLAILAYGAEGGTRSQEALSLLGSWAATLDQAQKVLATDEAGRAQDHHERRRER